MMLRVTYRQELGGPHAARRWTEEVQADDFIATVKRLIDDAEQRGCNITQVLVEGHQLQAQPA